MQFFLCQFFHISQFKFDFSFQFNSIFFIEQIFSILHFSDNSLLFSLFLFIRANNSEIQIDFFVVNNSLSLNNLKIVKFIEQNSLSQRQYQENQRQKKSTIEN